MRMLIVFLLSVAGIAGVFALSPQLRTRTAEVLLHTPSQPETAGPYVSHGAGRAGTVMGTLSRMGEGAAKAVNKAATGTDG